MNNEELMETIIDMLKERGMSFFEAKRFLEIAIYKLGHEKLPPKSYDKEKKKAAQCECAAGE